MNKLQQKLTSEIEKQEAKAPAQHRVPGYLQTALANAALANARARQKWASYWRKLVIDSGADGEYKVVESGRTYSRTWNVYTRDGVDVMAVNPRGGSNSPRLVREEDLKGRTVAEYLTGLYPGNVRVK